MGESQVTSFAGRRLRNGTVTVVLAIALAIVVYLQHVMLRDASFLTGWLLVAGVLLLAAYNIRKKLAFLPAADSASWMQLHVYLGLLTIVVFFMHVGLKPPSGRLESLLWALFVTLAVSGIFGLIVTRLVPGRLTERGERIIHERIPRFRAELAGEVEALAAVSVSETALGTIASYYSRRLQPFFAGPRNFWRHLAGSRQHTRRIGDELSSLERYLPPSGRAILSEIEARVLAKDNLDFQYAWQKLLKGWLFVHLPLTYAAIIVALVHVVLVYAFTSSSP